MFVGRDDELRTLEERYARGRFEMVVMYGRRRIGKTTLIREFIKGKPAIFFTAQEANDHMNLMEFSRRVYAFFGIPASAGAFASWNDAFDFLGEEARKKRFVLAFDEFPYAASANKGLRSVLQNYIDNLFCQTGLFLILCGSQISWMESEVLGSKSPLFGRRTAQMRLEAFDYIDAARFMEGFDAEDKIRLYGCLGGTPHYLAQIDPTRSFEENIVHLYFQPAGYLYGEPIMLLQQELREPAMYNAIISAIATGASRLNEISTEIGEAPAKTMKYIDVLLSMRILKRIFPFGDNPQRSRNGLYQIADHCFAFWYRYVFFNRASIDAGFGGEIARQSVFPLLSDYIGKPVFEEVCRQYLMRRAKAGTLPIPAVHFGRWWGNDSVLRKQTDLDVIAASPDQIIIGECKWRQTDSLSADQISAWMAKTHLLPEYKDRYYYCFSKSAFKPPVTALAQETPRLTLVPLDQLWNMEES